MTNVYYYPKESEKELKKMTKNERENRIINEKRFNLVTITFMRAKNNDEYAKLDIPMIGICYVYEYNSLYPELRYAFVQNNEEKVALALEKLLEEIKENINVFKLYSNMLEYAKVQSENAQVSMKWEMQQKFRELIGIED